MTCVCGVSPCIFFVFSVGGMYTVLLGFVNGLRSNPQSLVGM